MTRGDLISSLYSNFKKMHALWMDFSCTRGVGALMFFSKDYEPACDFSEVHWEFWERDRLLNYMFDGMQEKVSLKLEEEDFLNRMNSNEFLSVVVRGNDSDDRFEFEIHRIDGALLN
jgi:hypothetical protein